MSYPNSGSMSPPPKPPAQNFPPYQNAASPTATSPFAPPPAKRPRLSPDIRSPPNGTTNHVASPAIPVGGYGNPYSQSPTQSLFTTTSPAPFNTPQSYQAQHVQWQTQPSTPGGAAAGRQGSPPNSQTHNSQMMPPPPRPNKEEKDDRISADDIGDSLFGSGINLKEEENYMHSTFNNRHALDSFTSQTSFGSATSSTNNSFNILTQGTSFGSQGPDGAFAGTMGKPQSQEDIEIQERRRRLQAANARNEARQHHLQNQFLNGNCVRRRMDLRSANEGVILPTLGLFVRTEPETRVAVNGAGTQGIVAVRPESVVDQGSPFDHLLSLVSLAANERLRGLLNEAFALSRARRYGDHGRVPPDLSDLAIGEGKAVTEKVIPENITGTQWDRLSKTPDPDGDNKVSNGQEERKGSISQAQPTLAFQGKLNISLQEIADRDKQAEKDRIKKREARRRQAEKTGNAEDGSGQDANTGESGSAETPIKMTKKEQAKQAKAAASAAESESHTTTNQTAAMMALGKKGNRYAWMSGGAAQMPTNRFAKSTASSGTATPTAKADDVNSQTAVSNAGSGQNVTSVALWGDFREDGPGGRGIQARDLAFVLERDGKEKKALQRVLNKLGST